MKILIYTILGIIPYLLFSCAEDVSDLCISKPENENVIFFDNSEYGVSYDDLLKVIDNHFGKTKARSSKQTVQALNDSAGNPLIYCVNFGESSGFMLISATKKFEPVLAYNETGHFDINIKNSPVEAWTDVVENRIIECLEMPEDSVMAYIAHWRDILYNNKTVNPAKTRSRGEGDLTNEEYLELNQIVHQTKYEFEKQGYRIYPITEDVTGDPTWCAYIQERAAQAIYPIYDHAWEDLSFIVEIDDFESFVVPNCINTKWIQYYGFEKAFTSKGDGKHAVYAGCGPVAAGQIMYYYRYPDYFEWDVMDPVYGTDEASALLLDIAERSHAEYIEDYDYV